MDSHSKDELEGRRAFLGKLAVAGATGFAFANSGFAGAAELHAATIGFNAPMADEHWLDKLTAKHKQLVDAYSANEGWPLGFAHTFLATQNAAAGTHGAVLVLRHTAMPLALDHSLWAKYKIGEAFKIEDPATKKHAVKNPFFKPAPGTLLVDDMSVDRLVARGVFVGACNVALTVLSGMLAPNAGVTKEAAAKEWAAGIIPGISLLPSGTWGVNRAQEHGCTYCTGGGV
jgi:hypothetical protein